MSDRIIQRERRRVVATAQLRNHVGVEQIQGPCSIELDRRPQLTLRRAGTSSSSWLRLLISQLLQLMAGHVACSPDSFATAHSRLLATLVTTWGPSVSARFNQLAEARLGVMNLPGSQLVDSCGASHMTRIYELDI